MRRTPLFPKSTWREPSMWPIPFALALASILCGGAGAAIGREAEAPGARPPAEAASPGPEEGGDDEFESERDSFTPATTVVGKGRLLAEAAYSFIDNRHGDDSHSFPELLTRVGVAERIELRLGWNYEMGGGGSVSGSGSSAEVE